MSSLSGWSTTGATSGSASVCIDQVCDDDTPPSEGCDCCSTSGCGWDLLLRCASPRSLSSSSAAIARWLVEAVSCASCLSDSTYPVLKFLHCFPRAETSLFGIGIAADNGLLSTSATNRLLPVALELACAAMHTGELAAPRASALVTLHFRGIPISLSFHS
jgi:hypothetical protein